MLRSIRLLGLLDRCLRAEAASALPLSAFSPVPGRGAAETAGYSSNPAANGPTVDKISHQSNKANRGIITNTLAKAKAISRSNAGTTTATCLARNFPRERDSIFLLTGSSGPTSPAFLSA